jgi:hypothetical protein
MKPTPFVEGRDIAPIPFSRVHCEAARELKERGLPWRPHAGCFVWDEQGSIDVSSPFPNDVYFILNLGRFLQIFQTVEEMVTKLVWLPTWHQARVLCQHFNVNEEEIDRALTSEDARTVGQDVLLLYRLLLDKQK